MEQKMLRLKWVTSMLTSCHLGQTSSFNLKESGQGHHGDTVAYLSTFVDSWNSSWGLWLPALTWTQWWHRARKLHGLCWAKWLGITRGLVEASGACPCPPASEEHQGMMASECCSFSPSIVCFPSRSTLPSQAVGVSLKCCPPGRGWFRWQWGQRASSCGMLFPWPVWGRQDREELAFMEHLLCVRHCVPLTDSSE